MNKRKPIFSSLKEYLTPKFILFSCLAIFIVYGAFFWMNQKNRVSIKEHLFLVAADNRWLPLDLPGQNRYMQGFVSELLEVIGKDEGIKIQMISVGTSQFFDNLEKGYYDGIISALPPSVLNQDKYLFSEPFYLTGPVLIVPLDSKAKSISDLHTVGIKRGSLALSALGQPLTSTITYDNLNMALSDLISGKIDGLIMDSLNAYANVRGYYKDMLKIATPPLNKEGLRLITTHNFYGKALIKIFNEGVEKAKEDKIYEKLLDKWELINPESAYK